MEIRKNEVSKLKMSEIAYLNFLTENALYKHFDVISVDKDYSNADLSMATIHTKNNFNKIEKLRNYRFKGADNKLECDNFINLIENDYLAGGERV